MCGLALRSKVRDGPGGITIGKQPNNSGRDVVVASLAVNTHSFASRLLYHAASLFLSFSDM